MVYSGFCGIRSAVPQEQACGTRRTARRELVQEPASERDIGNVRNTPMRTKKPPDVLYLDYFHYG